MSVCVYFWSTTLQATLERLRLVKERICLKKIREIHTE